MNTKSINKAKGANRKMGIDDIKMRRVAKL